MTVFDGATLFGYASTCKSLQDVTKLLREVIGDDAKSATAAYGMLLVANLTNPGPYRDNALEALNQLARAKAELDIAAVHIPPVTEVTAKILHAAQSFADEMTIPCTEWPTVEEITNIVFQEAKLFAKVNTWELYKYDKNNTVVGSYIVEDWKTLDNSQ